jgi:hypothetical protein
VSLRLPSRQTFIKGQTGQVLVSYPPIVPHSAASLSSPLAWIGTPGSALDLTAAGTAATRESDGDGTTSAHEMGDALITVTSAIRTPGFKAGYRYVIDNLAGNEPIEVMCSLSIDGSGDPGTGFLGITEPLNAALAASSPVFSHALKITLSADQVASIGRGVVQWRVTYAANEDESRVLTWADSFQVVERASGYTLSAPTLMSFSPYAKNHKPEGDVDYTETIDAAWRRYMEPALLAKGIRPELFVSRTECEAAHIAACEHYLAQQFENEGDVREEKRREFTEALNLLLNSETLWVGDEAETLTPPEASAPRAYNTTMQVR